MYKQTNNILFFPYLGNNIQITSVKTGFISLLNNQINSNITNLTWTLISDPGYTIVALIDQYNISHLNTMKDNCSQTLSFEFGPVQTGHSKQYCIHSLPSHVYNHSRYLRVIYRNLEPYSNQDMPGFRLSYSLCKHPS